MSRRSRRRLIWHIGLEAAARPVLPANLEVHAAALGATGARVVASAAEADRATRELLRTHREGGFRRRAVEGTWAAVCDRVWEHRGVSLLSTPELCRADKDQVRQALDPLTGVEVHLVVTCDALSEQVYGAWLAELRAGGTTGWEKYAERVLAPVPGHRQAEEFRAGHDLVSILERWGWTLRPERSHVLADPRVERHWSDFLEVAGLGLDECDREEDPDLADGACLAAVVPAYADPAGAAVLRGVNRQLEDPLTHTGSRLVAPRDAAGPMPTVATGALGPAVEAWQRTLEAAGYDVRGDLSALVAGGPDVALPGPRDQLGVAVDALAESLAENSRLRETVAQLESEHRRLRRKRRKLRLRLARAMVSREK